MTTLENDILAEQQQQIVPVVALKDALAYTIANAVANGAGWADDITKWARNHRQLRPHPEAVSGADLVRAALSAEDDRRNSFERQQALINQMREALRECMKDSFTASDGMAQSGDRFAKERYRMAVAALQTAEGEEGK